VAYSAPTARVVPAAPDDDGPDGGDGDGGGGDGGGSSDGSGQGGGAPAPVAATPPANPAAPRLEISAGLGSTTRRSLTVAYGRAVTVRGVVHDATGTPARSTVLSLLAAVDGRWRPAGTTSTGPDGRFTIVAGTGPSRRLVVSAGAVRSRPLRLAVRAAVTLRAARQGRWTMLRGTLRGGHVPPGGVLVSVQARRAGNWVTLRTLVSDRRGRFHGRVATACRLRTRVARQPGYPFAAGWSPARP
jgi:hypothetical protein